MHLAEVSPLRVLRLSLMLIIVSVSFCSFHLAMPQASEGYWTLVDEDYFGLLQSLMGHAQWSYSTSRGPDDRWVINLTISYFGFNPTTVLICDQGGFMHWQETGSSSQCQLVHSVNSSLDTSIDLLYYSRWYFVLNNTGPITLYYTLRITHYHWTTATLPTNPLDDFSPFANLIVYVIILGVIVFIIIPCFCNFSCIGRFRRDSKKKRETQEGQQNYNTYLIVTPDQIQSFIPDEDDEY